MCPLVVRIFKAQDEVNIARSYRLPAFSLAALGSQSLAHLGLTLPLGSLSVYPNVGPIPGRTTTLAGPLQPGGFSMQVSRSHWGGFNVSGQVNHFQGGVAARKEKP